MMPAVIAVLMTAILAWLTPAPHADHLSQAFDVEQDGETTAVIAAGCTKCDWGAPGREAAVLRIEVDGKYSQHLVLTRGEALAKYALRLGRLSKGRHRLVIDRDRRLSSIGAGRATIEVVEVSVDRLGPMPSTVTMTAGCEPILYARPNTVGKFTDVPLVMWSEFVETPRGHQTRYSVIFSNEDGGTQTDRLMATWGRTTDIEYVYGVETDDAYNVLAEEFQGPGHEVPAFHGKHEGCHPLLWVSTDNNMVSESGPTTIRYAPAAISVDLDDQAREAVMDGEPWTYAVAAAEMRREGKVADDPPPGINKIPDPRRFVHVEACGTVGNAALAIAVGTFSRQAQSQSQSQSQSALTWTPSDRGLPQYRIVRDGCFTIATPLPAGTRSSDIRAIRVHAFERPPAEGKPRVAADPVTFTRINKVFMLDEHDLPGPSILKWEGSQAIRAAGEPFEIRIP